VTSIAPWHWPSEPFQDLARSDDTRNVLNQMSAGLAVACGAAGFFFARPLMPWLQPGGALAATSFYDTNSLKHTLGRRDRHPSNARPRSRRPENSAAALRSPSRARGAKAGRRIDHFRQFF
jgi:hypothetical protein